MLTHFRLDWPENTEKLENDRYDIVIKMVKRYKIKNEEKNKL